MSSSPCARALIVTSLAAAALAGCGGAPPPVPPSLVLISVDTLRPDRLACYGGPEHVGTGMCSLALEGSRFVWAMAPAPSTAPSIASLLTSQYPSRHGVSQFANTKLDDEIASVAEVLADAGYRTAAFVSNPVLARRRNLDQGFELYDDRMNRRERNRRLLERDAEATTDAALAWARVTPEPRFLWVHYQDPHGPYDPPETPTRRDPAGSTPLPILPHHSGHQGIPRYQALPGLRSIEAYEARYVEEIRYLDLHLARLLAGLDELGNPPAVILTADHGEAFGEDDHWFAHGHSVGIEQIRVPLLVRVPGAAGSSAVLEAVSTIDVAPTLLALAGLEIPAAFDGRPLPLSPSPSAAPAPAVFSEHRLRLAVVADGVYYARDREPLPAPVPDRITGGSLVPLPARRARLPAQGDLPDYTPTHGSALDVQLEERLAGFAARALPERDAEPLTPDDREALRSLGYLE